MAGAANALAAAVDDVAVGVRSHEPPPPAAEPSSADMERFVQEADDGPDDADVATKPDEQDPAEGAGVDTPDAGGEPAPAELPAEVRAEIDRANAHVEEVRTAAQATLAENQLLARKVDFLTKAIEEAGFAIDPMHLRLFELETAQELGTAESQARAQQQEASHKQAVEAEVRRINDEAAKAAKAAGLDGKDVAKRYAFAVKVWLDGGSQGAEPTIVDTVEEMRAISDARQRKASASVPALGGHSGARGVQPQRFDNTHAGWSRYLESQGLGDD